MIRDEEAEKRSHEQEARRPNILLILNDDMGYSDIGCYGGEVDTPFLNQLAEQGLRFTQFYNTARCSPSRASLLTGLHPHQTGIGVLVDDDGPEGYQGNLNKQCVTIAEVLRQAKYRTYMSGKWHIANNISEVTDTWPLQRGFDRYYGTLAGSGNFYYPSTLTRDNENIEHEALNKDYYYTDAISDEAVRFIKEHVEEYPDTPFFQYVAYTAPHWPLHAKEDDIAKYKDRFNAGWDQLRIERMQRMQEMGILNAGWSLTDRDNSQPAWEDAAHKEWEQRRMEVYAAQIDSMDQGIGRILQTLEETGQLEQTLILFLSDNGGCAEEFEPVQPNKIPKNWGRTSTGADVAFGNRPDVMPGAETTFQSYGTAWANLSNTPFRLYKHWVHEGGIATPFIVHWPEAIQSKGEIRHMACQLTDVMATILDITNAAYPATYNGHAICPPEGKSMKKFFVSDDHAEDRFLFWEHEGNAAVREGNWKLVKNYPGKWELFDMAQDRTEIYNLADQYPERVQQMIVQYDRWATRCGVKPREKILEIIAKRNRRK
ncbi:arylsulfatase [Paenibacillus agaridevorans]|uniref:Arylsulfatase n=1 Tax=Paenibacillus agaridevorans TaxID=171404 RepID=A0A2R5EWA0_9BACL|nr:arylsulfatase [Paenibacillus agaridevorans]GBG07681.1 arylsulfatase [Paenibacillus agaridevorans]